MFEDSTFESAGRIKSKSKYWMMATFITNGSILVLLILGGVAISLLRGAWPAARHFGFSFITREIWNPVTDEYGALAPIYGTVVTSLIAMALAVPAGFGIALFLTELCPPMLKRPIGVAVELLAAVPSIIFGWGRPLGRSSGTWWFRIRGWASWAASCSVWAGPSAKRWR